jgi:hypothetical protein
MELHDYFVNESRSVDDKEKYYFNMCRLKIFYFKNQNGQYHYNFKGKHEHTMSNRFVIHP